MSQLFQAEFDTVDDKMTEPDAIFEMQQLLNKYDIRKVLIEQSGSNGWPIYRYIGTKQALKKMIKQLWNDEELFDEIKVPTINQMLLHLNDVPGHQWFISGFKEFGRSDSPKFVPSKSIEAKSMVDALNIYLQITNLMPSPEDEIVLNEFSEDDTSFEFLSTNVDNTLHLSIDKRDYILGLTTEESLIIKIGLTSLESEIDNNLQPGYMDDEVRRNSKRIINRLKNSLK